MILYISNTLVPGPRLQTGAYIFPLQFHSLPATGTGSALNFDFFTEVGFYIASGYTASCSQQMAGENYILILTLPGQPDAPTSPDMVCSSDTSEYITNSAPNADTLTWILSPAEAGTMMPGAESVEIMWSAGFSGAAFLSVCGSNDCGDRPSSD